MTFIACPASGCVWCVLLHGICPATLRSGKFKSHLPGEDSKVRESVVICSRSVSHK